MSNSLNYDALRLVAQAGVPPFLLEQRTHQLHKAAQTVRAIAGGRGTEYAPMTDEGRIALPCSCMPQIWVYRAVSAPCSGPPPRWRYTSGGVDTLDAGVLATTSIKLSVARRANDFRPNSAGGVELEMWRGSHGQRV